VVGGRLILIASISPSSLWQRASEEIDMDIACLLDVGFEASE